MVTAYLALGANLGDRLGSLQGGRAALDDLPGVRVAAASALYETAPVGGPLQPNYLNAVLRVETDLLPAELLHTALEIENRFGRRREEPWGPRTLDIDLLLYGDLVLESSELRLPHPYLRQRPFVLVPLADLAPDLPLPPDGRTPRQLIERIGAAGVDRLADSW